MLKRVGYIVAVVAGVTFLNRRFTKVNVPPFR